MMPPDAFIPPGTTNPVPVNNVATPIPVTLYEYRTLWYGDDISGDTIERLNALGREGWHVVAEADKRLILERPLVVSHEQVGPITSDSP